VHIGCEFRPAPKPSVNAICEGFLHYKPDPLYQGLPLPCRPRRVGRVLPLREKDYPTPGIRAVRWSARLYLSCFQHLTGFSDSTVGTFGNLRALFSLVVGFFRTLIGYSY